MSLKDVKIEITDFRPGAVMAGAGDEFYVSIGERAVRIEKWSTDSSDGTDAYLMPAASDPHGASPYVNLDLDFGDGVSDAVDALMEGFQERYWARYRAEIAPLERGIIEAQVHDTKPVTVEVEDAEEGEPEVAEQFSITVTRSPREDGAVVIFIDGDYPDLRVHINDNEVYASTPLGEDGDDAGELAAEAREFTFAMPAYLPPKED